MLNQKAPGVLFVCLGNICRSTMAESVMTYLAEKAEVLMEVDSAGTSDEEHGNPPHHGTQAKLAQEDIPLKPHRARRITPADYSNFDYIVYMDDSNGRDLLSMLGGDPQHKMHRLLDYAPNTYAEGRKEVADPWWTGNFDLTFEDIMAGCTGLLSAIQH